MGFDGNGYDGLSFRGAWDTWAREERGVIFERFVNGRRTGLYQVFDDAGLCLCEGALVDDQPIGRWVFRNKQTTFSMEFGSKGHGPVTSTIGIDAVTVGG